MTHAPRRDDELEELAAAIVDATITPSQQARLEQLLDGDRAAQRQFALAMALHASLYGYGAEAEEEAAAPSRPWKVRLAETARRLARPTPLSFAVATVVIGLIVGAMAYFVAPIYQARSRAQLAEIDATRIVAQLTRVQEAQWVEGQVGAQPGSHLLVGHRMQLVSGLAEVTFNDGAVVVLAGPARLEVRDTAVATLHAGRLRAKVPQRAIGFRVNTPAMEIVDLGTEFGVEVAADQATEVHVLSGSVAISPVETRSPRTPLVLSAGQALALRPGGRPGQPVASAPGRFALEIVDAKTLVLQAGRVSALTGGTYDGVDDVALIQWAANSNFGARPDFDIGQHNHDRAHALLRFDLTALAGKVDRLLSVTLRIQPHTDVFYFPWRQPGEIELHRVSDANADWREGLFATAGGGNTGQEDATWNFRHQPSEPWTGTAGASRAGVDYDATPLAKVGYVPRTGYPLDFTLKGDLEFLHAWIAGESNGGFLLRETTGAPSNRINFHSSESAVVAARPQLIVVYLPITKRTLGETPVPP